MTIFLGEKAGVAVKGTMEGHSIDRLLVRPGKKWSTISYLGFPICCRREPARHFASAVGIRENDSKPALTTAGKMWNPNTSLDDRERDLFSLSTQIDTIDRHLVVIYSSSSTAAQVGETS